MSEFARVSRKSMYPSHSLDIATNSMPTIDEKAVGQQVKDGTARDQLPDGGPSVSERAHQL